MIRRTLLLLLLPMLLLAACGVSGTGGFDEIDPTNMPGVLTATTTTTTTLQTTSTTLELENTTTTISAMTSTTVVATELVDVYFVVSRQIVKLEWPFPRNPAVAQVIPVLEEDPKSDLTPGVRTAVPPGLMTVTGENRGVVTVDLDPTFFDNPRDPRDPTLAIAQIVMTLTRLSGISEVNFTQNDEPALVPLADSSTSDPGQLLNYEDYERLLTSSPPVATTTTTTTTTPPPPDSTTPDSGAPATG